MATLVRRAAAADGPPPPPPPCRCLVRRPRAGLYVQASPGSPAAPDASRSLAACVWQRWSVVPPRRMDPLHLPHPVGASCAAHARGGYAQASPGSPAAPGAPRPLAASLLRCRPVVPPWWISPLPPHPVGALCAAHEQAGTRRAVLPPLLQRRLPPALVMIPPGGRPVHCLLTVLARRVRDTAAFPASPRLLQL